MPAAYIELAKLKTTPTDAELLNQLEDTATMVRPTALMAYLPKDFGHAWHFSRIAHRPHRSNVL